MRWVRNLRGSKVCSEQIVSSRRWNTVKQVKRAYSDYENANNFIVSVCVRVCYLLQVTQAERISWQPSLAFKSSRQGYE